MAKFDASQDPTINAKWGSVCGGVVTVGPTNPPVTGGPTDGPTAGPPGENLFDFRTAISPFPLIIRKKKETYFIDRLYIVTD